MLKAWEAMRLGKDAQIAALMERNKRMEEDSAEKARTVDALRRKIATLTATSVAAAASASTSAGGGPMAGSGSAPGSRTHSYSGYAAPQAVAPSGGVGHAPAPGVPVGVMALGAPAAPPSMRGSVSSVSGGAQHIHVHMHGPSSPGSTAGTAHTTTLQRTVPTTPVARML